MKLLFCAENLFDELQFPGQTLSADSSASGFGPEHVATNRRYPGDRWEPATANADHYIRSTQVRIRAANFLAIDRRGNQLGKKFKVRLSMDESTYQETSDFTFAQVPGGDLLGANGIVTEEMACLKLFSTPLIALTFDLYSYAMGAGIAQQLVGAWLGMAWTPTDFVITDHADDETYTAQYNTSQSTAGWKARSRVSRPRTGSITVKLSSFLDYDMVRYQVLGLYARGVPAWICHDRENGPQRAFLASCPAGQMDFGAKQAWLDKRMITIPFEEEQPDL